VAAAREIKAHSRTGRVRRTFDNALSVGALS
jgi:hypothetical protein